jgi:hypothetical protein
LIATDQVEFDHLAIRSDRLLVSIFCQLLLSRAFQHAWPTSKNDALSSKRDFLCFHYTDTDLGFLAANNFPLGNACAAFRSLPECGCSSKTVAKDAEKERRRKLEESYNQIKRRTLPPTFGRAASQWLEAEKPHLAERTYSIYEVAIRCHLTPALGPRLLCDIDADVVAAS